MAIKPPSISVILPAYNAESTILEAVHSILDGTFEDHELIVVDDGSTDRTWELLQSIKDARLVLSQSMHQGVVATANKASSMAKANWIARMDADDISHPHRLQEQWSCAKEQGCDIVSGLVRIVDMQGKPVQSMQRYQNWLNSLTNHDDIFANRFVELPLVNPSIMARRELFLNRCRQGPFPEDYDQWLRALAEGAKTGKTESYILDWRDQENRLTRRDPRYKREAFDLCKKHYLLTGPLHGINKITVWGVGQTGKPWLKWLQKQGFEIPFAVDVSPRKIGKMIHGVEVISPEQLSHIYHPEIPIVAAVGAAGARETIMTFLEGLQGFSRKNLWFVA